MLNGDRMEVISKTLTRIIAMAYMLLIINGNITSPDQLPGKINKNDLQSLGGTIQCENGDCKKILCPFYTGCVVLNRLHSTVWSGDTIDEVVNAKEDGKYWQYAYSTRRDYKTKKCSERTLLIAKYLLIFYEPGLQVPKTLIYQGRNSNAGSGVFWDDDDGEYFCYGKF